MPALHSSRVYPTVPTLPYPPLPTAGSFLGSTAGSGGGAASALFDSTLAIRGGTHRGNTALYGPGGAALALAGSTLLVSDGARFEDSAAPGGYGGALAGIYNHTLDLSVRGRPPAAFPVASCCAACTAPHKHAS